MSRTSIAVFIFMLCLFSCEEGWITDCRECDENKPGTVNLKIYVRNPEAIPAYPVVTLYDGAIEDSIVLRRYTMEDPYALTIYYDALLYKDYTATVEFNFDGRNYLLIDAACPELRYDETSCDNPCYYVFNNVIDLRLRYY